MENVIYVGVFLDSLSRAELLKEYPPIHQVVYADHVTLKFAPKFTDIKMFDIGRHVNFHVIGHAFDKKCQAVLVELDKTIMHKENPHVTISTLSGTKPVYSNTLLSTSSIKSVKNGLVMSGRIDTYPRTYVIKDQ